MPLTGAKGRLVSPDPRDEGRLLHADKRAGRVCDRATLSDASTFVSLDRVKVFLRSKSETMRRKQIQEEAIRSGRISRSLILSPSPPPALSPIPTPYSPPGECPGAGNESGSCQIRGISTDAPSGGQGWGSLTAEEWEHWREGGKLTGDAFARLISSLVKHGIPRGSGVWGVVAATYALSADERRNSLDEILAALSRWFEEGRHGSRNLGTAQGRHALLLKAKNFAKKLIAGGKGFVRRLRSPILVGAIDALLGT
jgi:hypothetical protein